MANIYFLQGAVKEENSGLHLRRMLGLLCSRHGAAASTVILGNKYGQKRAEFSCEGTWSVLSCPSLFLGTLACKNRNNITLLRRGVTKLTLQEYELSITLSMTSLHKEQVQIEKKA